MDPVTQGQQALAQNVAVVLAGNNQALLEEVDLTAQSMRQFMIEVRDIIGTQATEFTTLKARIVQLEKDKKDMEEANKTNIAAVNSLISTKDKAVTDKFVQVDANHNALATKYNNHRHNIAQGGRYCTCSSAKEFEDEVAAIQAQRRMLA